MVNDLPPCFELLQKAIFPLRGIRSLLLHHGHLFSFNDSHAGSKSVGRDTTVILSKSKYLAGFMLITQGALDYSNAPLSEVATYSLPLSLYNKRL